MKRRTRAATVLAFLLIASAIGFAAPATTVAIHEGCDGFGTQPHWVGDLFTPVDANAIGVDATIDISGSHNIQPPTSGTSWFGPCSPLSELGAAGSFAYVGIRSVNDPTKYVTLGVTRCYRGLWPIEQLGPCDGTGGGVQRPTPRFFWSVNTCNDNPLAYDLGAAGYGAHTFKITRDLTGTNHFKFVIDGVTVKTLALSHNWIDCWSTGLKRAWIAGQPFDQADQLGNGASLDLKTQFYYMEARTIDGGWSPWTPSCTYNNPTIGHAMQCNSGGNFLRVWTAEV